MKGNLYKQSGVILGKRRSDFSLLQNNHKWADKMKGVTPVIAVILLLLITIAMAGFAFIFFTRIMGAATNATEAELANTLLRQHKKIAIDNIDNQRSNISIKSIDTAIINVVELNFYINNTNYKSEFFCYELSIEPGETITCSFSTDTNSCTSSNPLFVGNSKNDPDRICSCATGSIIRITAPGNEDVEQC